jgi:hypothetical protein
MTETDGFENVLFDDDAGRELKSAVTLDDERVSLSSSHDNDDDHEPDDATKTADIDDSVRVSSVSFCWTDFFPPCVSFRYFS